ncbi:hypothetical protein [Candidatus Nanohalococcus occultus]|uniref:hypothetical protein n=1 Tax=Candidatus Nanohalococcus occultus TaxID=2978047 RepID=UPI0039E0D918
MITQIRSDTAEYMENSANSLFVLAFSLLTAITYGLQDELESFLTSLTQTAFTLGPFEITSAMIGSTLIVIGAGGLKTLNPDNDRSDESVLGIIVLLALMGLPQFRNWATQGAASVALFLITLGLYASIGIGKGDKSLVGMIRKNPKELV